MKDDDGTDIVDPTSTQDQLDIHYAEALQSIRLARRDHERTRALGAAQALEQLADALGIDLAYDRRRYGAW